MISRMALLNGDKNAAAGIADLSTRDEFRLDSCTVIRRINNPGLQCYRAVDRRRAKQLYMEFGCNGTRRLIFSTLFHEVISGRPIRVTIEERADDASVQHPRKSLVMRLGIPFRDELIALGKASNSESLFIGRAAAEANAAGRIRLLYR